MKKLLALAAITAGLIGGAWISSARAGWPQDCAYWRSTRLPWHNGFYDLQYGEPIALVVPPTAEYQSNYGWGVGGTRTARVYHQFSRPYPGPGEPMVGPAGFWPTPAWPSDTQQFGVYYIRGPW